MIIEKSGVSYVVTQSPTKWMLSAVIKDVNIAIEVSKADCETFEDLVCFIESNDDI